MYAESTLTCPASNLRADPFTQVNLVDHKEALQKRPKTFNFGVKIPRHFGN
jgi:hypothetical protein